MVIQVFVDSYPYIPEHRRHLLFNKLLTVIGEKQYLWRLMLLLMKLVVTKGTLKAELTSESQEVSSKLNARFFCFFLRNLWSSCTWSQLNFFCAANVYMYLRQYFVGFKYKLSIGCKILAFQCFKSILYGKITCTRNHLCVSTVYLCFSIITCSIFHISVSSRQ